LSENGDGMTNDGDGRIARRGVLFVLSSPSGAGKTSIARRLLELEPETRISVSATTRPKRPDEMDGRDYHFFSQAKFDQMAEQGGFLEHAEVFGHRYGTPRDQAEEILAGGFDVIFDIDWQGAQQLTQAAARDVVRVFVLPPSLGELESRLRRRAQDSAEVVAARMAEAVDEMSHYGEYDYVLINRALDDSVAEARAILNAERTRRERYTGLDDFVHTLTEDRG
jgi:guanylate kinase|tara:strand:+ start:104 stop:775 length:672 start_codon:yes stop_codon:yes gene_type:complete